MNDVSKTLRALAVYQRETIDRFTITQRPATLTPAEVADLKAEALGLIQELEARADEVNEHPITHDEFQALYHRFRSIGYTAPQEFYQAVNQAIALSLA